ncbi:bifunctional 4-hydroxy-2-oxoglutarate aldolase/2-dehydro-3-deoxy-phosphogluconate aldolase [Shouchella hunanensis]|uniref:Bifunctional 4-hydroxy-2-oxoglutarate aldolase/2-dehydro-3-deoxy-phosphogluconate aldolase n=1 Tax=Shouchella hunanensis TaxID=766894 RepID=A0ABY7W2U9_9BACI|nr:bifunctional 4-hydroxy-2-oxoglutarate aldolase/2-dehydro-3-deoxy-phosphogluconate aldolase [Shouchella hunanensis]WDF03275.1 bifunctional 4-hydroxy-2-oxoglutarate aldolase/2-dehydro-3-deoxy-phosphogluconate aldolase [Shouchella hunanensis]GAF24010.1 4-hydroxy-2-oxoglutarate aldolase [Bacillus sp. JCM 19047]
MHTQAKIHEEKLIAIIRDAQPEDLLNISEALLKGGISLIEVTLNSPQALHGIARLKKAFGTEIIIGAGTVLDPESAKAAIDSGADFLLSPTVNEETIKLTKRYGKVSIPGAFTPTEILSAYECGADFIKVFPARMGPEYIKDIKGPLPHIPLVPTGGVNERNVQAFLSAGGVACGIGSSLVNTSEAVTKQSLEELTRKAEHFVSLTVNS